MVFVLLPCKSNAPSAASSARKQRTSSSYAADDGVQSNEVACYAVPIWSHVLAVTSVRCDATGCRCSRRVPKPRRHAIDTASCSCCRSTLSTSACKASTMCCMLQRKHASFSFVARNAKRQGLHHEHLTSASQLPCTTASHRNHARCARGSKRTSEATSARSVLATKMAYSSPSMGSPLSPVVSVSLLDTKPCASRALGYCQLP